MSPHVAQVVAALSDAHAVLEKALADRISLIAIKLLITVAREADNHGEEGPTVKKIFAAMPSSQRGVRLQFNRLISEGLLELRPGKLDKRTKVVRLSAAGEAMFSELAKKVSTHLGRPPR